MNCTLIKKSCVGLLAIILSTSCADLTENLTGQPTVDKFFQTLTDFIRGKKRCVSKFGRSENI